MGDKVMSGRESTTHTMALMDRADLPWRAGEWFVLRILAVVIAAIGGFVLFGSHQIFGVIFGIILGFILPPVILRYLAKRRAKKFEAALPDVLMLVATSLASGFSLLQALDSVAKDAPEPASKEFSPGPGRGADRLRRQRRARPHGRPDGQQEHALDHDGDPHPARGRRQPGRDPAHHRRHAARARDAQASGARRCRRRASSRHTSSSRCPSACSLFSTLTNYDYVSLLWTTVMGIVMSIAGLIAMAIGIWWMSKVVKIEV